MSVLVWRRHAALSLAVLAAVSGSGCGADERLTKTPLATDSWTAPEATDTDTDTAGTASDSVTSSATETEATDTTPRPVDTEGDNPPALPALCTVAVPATSASEPLDNLHPGDKGDARAPVIATVPGGALLGWDYHGNTADARWHTVVAPYTPPATSGEQDPALLLPARLQPMTAGPSTRDPALAVNASGALGLLVRDARWDPACDGTASAPCLHELGLLGLDASGSPTGAADPVRLTHSAGVQITPALAAVGNTFVATWIDWSDGEVLRLLAATVDPLSGPGPVVELARDADLDGQHVPGIASNGERAVVVWVASRERAVYAVALSAAGAVLGERQIIDEGAYVIDARIAATPSGFVTAFRRTVDEVNATFDVWTRPLSAAGAPLGSVRRATWTTSAVTGLSLASHGEEVALAWVSGRDNGTATDAVSTGADEIFATLLDADGQAKTAAVALSADPNPASAVAIGYDGGGWTALWEHRRNFRQQVYLGRVVCGN